MPADQLAGTLARDDPGADRPGVQAHVQAGIDAVAGPAVMAPCAWMPSPARMAPRRGCPRRRSCPTGGQVLAAIDGRAGWMPQPALSALAAMTEPPALRPWPQAMASSQATSWPACRWPPTVILPPARTSHLARALPAVQCVGRLDAPFGADVAARAQQAGAGDLGARLDVLAGDHRFAGADAAARDDAASGAHHGIHIDALRTSIVPANTTALASISSSRSTASVGPNWSSSQQASPTRPSATRASSTA